MTKLYSNNATTTTTASVLSTDTTIYCNTTIFPAFSAGDEMWLTLVNSSGTVYEIVKCTAATATSYTVERGVGNTTPLDWPSNTTIELRITSELMHALFSELNPDILQFTGGTGTQGTLTWNVDDETINLDVGNGVVYQLGQELGQTARNISGVTITNGTVVQITGASGAKPTITVADNSNEGDSSATFAIVTEDISDNSTGRVTTDGLVRNLDTSLLAEGSAIWLSTTGTFTDVKPSTPAHLVHLGWCVRSHATEGIILVKVSNGWELEELHDVFIVDIAANEILQWDGSKWINKTLAEAGIQNILSEGAFIDGDKTKLDGIEAGATADQTALEIKTAYESNANTNVYTDAEKTKLAGIEAGATAHQSAGEVPYSNVASNLVATDVQSAVDEVESRVGALEDVSHSHSNKTVLDNTTASYTAAEEAKLAGIEAGATADQTKADIDALGINADLLDGQHGSYYTGYVDTAIANLVDTAPTTLDTLNELAAALGDDPNFATTVSTQIGTKLDATANAVSASKLATARNIALSGDVSGSVNFDGSANVSITATVADDSHNHTIANVDGLQTALDGKSATTHNHTLDSLSNTTIISNTTGEILKWNGIAWINNTLSEAGIQPAGSYLTGNQTITLSGDVSGSGTTSIVVTVADDSHNHIIDNVDGLQAALDGKVDDNQVLTNVPAGAVFTDTTYSVGNGGLTEINFTSALNTKLSGIEIGATADQVASEVPYTNTTSGLTATDTQSAIDEVEGRVDTIESAGYITDYTVTETDVTQHQAALAITESQISDFGSYEPADATILKDADIGVTVQGYDANIVSDASYVHTDNNYTTTEKSKLAGIESGATADQTAAEILSLVKTVDGASSGLDADLLDGNHASAFYLASNPSNYISGNQTITLSGDLTGSGTTAINAQLAANVVGAGELNVTGNGTTAQYLRSDGDGSFTWATPTDTNTTYTAGSGLTLTGTSFSHSDTSSQSSLTALTGANVVSDIDVDGYGHVTSMATRTMTLGDLGYTGETNATADQTAAEILTAIKTVDGTGSGLDADLLDGQQGSYYQPVSTALTTSTTFGGDVSGTYNAIVVADDSHNHVISNIDGLQAALDAKLDDSQKGAANGLAELDATGKVPSAQLPSYVDDVLEYANAGSFPATGEAGKLYVALDSNDVYRWTGSAYVKVSDAVSTADQATKLATARNIALSGDVSGSANFDGSANISITATVADDSHNHIIGNVDGLQAALDGKLSTTGKAADSNLLDGLDSTAFYLASNPSGYTSNVGDITNVSAGTGLSGGGASGSVTLNVDLSELTDMTAAMIGTDEFIVLDAGADRRKAANEIGLSIFSNDAGFTTNVGDITGVTAGSGISGGGTSGTVTVSHADTSSQGSVNNSGATVIQDVTLDTYGHVTGLASKTLTAADVGAITGNQVITLSGDVSGSGTTSINVTVADDSHNHVISNIDGLQTTLNSKLDTAGGKLTGTLAFSLNSVSASTASTAIDLLASNFHVVTMTTNTTFSFSNLVGATASSGTLVIKQDAVGGRTFTLPTEAKTPVGGAAISQSTGANTTSIISYLVVSSTEVLVNYVGDFA